MFFACAAFVRVLEEVESDLVRERLRHERLALIVGQPGKHGPPP